MTINSSSIPASNQPATKSGALLAGLFTDSGAAKRSGQSFAQLLGSVTQPPAKPAQPPLPERPPMPRVEVEPPAREPDVPRSTEPVPVAPDRAPSPAERSSSASAGAARNDRPGIKPAAQPANTPANATGKAKHPAAAAKPPGQNDASATDKAAAAADDAVSDELAADKPANTAAAANDTGLAATLLTTATPEQSSASPPPQNAVLAGAGGAAGLDASAFPNAAPEAAAEPASLASLMPSVAQAVFGQVAVDTTSGSAKADTAAGTFAPGGGTLPLAGAELAQSSTPAVAAARAKADPVAADPPQQASTASMQRTESPSMMLASAAQESTKALAIEAKPQAGAASFGQLLQAATAAAPTGPNNAQPSAATASPVTVNSSLHDPGFAPEMATRLTLLASEGVHKAQLHLNPAEMGPVSVQIQLDGQQAQVEFHAQHAATREVLERSLPELAAALRDAGMTLSGGGVFQQPRDAQQDSQAQNQASGQGTNGRAGTSGPSDDIGSTVAQQAGRRTQVGVLDMYA